MKSKKKLLAEFFEYLRKRYLGTDEEVKKFFKELDLVEAHLAHRRKLAKERKFLKSMETAEIKQQNEYNEIEDEQLRSSGDSENILIEEDFLRVKDYLISKDVRDFVLPLVLIEEQRCVILNEDVPYLLHKTKEQLK